MFKVVPKFHLMDHLCDLFASLWGSPRYFWTYSDEDLVGILTEVAESVHMNTLPMSVLFKWMWLCFDAEDAYPEE